MSGSPLQVHGPFGSSFGVREVCCLLVEGELRRPHCVYQGVAASHDELRDGSCVDHVFQCGQSIAAEREDQPSTSVGQKAEKVTVVKMAMTYLLRDVKKGD